MEMENEINVNGQVYVLKKTLNQQAKKIDNMLYVIVRTNSAGVFAGYLKSKIGQEVELINVRRLWYWSGAASLSQLAMEGVANPKDCKFPCEVDSIILDQTIETITCTEQARLSIKNVPIWKI